MNGFDTQSKKAERAYRNLLIAVLCQDDFSLIEMFKSEAENLMHKSLFMKNINKAANKYYLHSQAGRNVLILKSSPLGKILSAKISMAETELEKAKRKAEFLKKFCGKYPEEIDSHEL